MHARYRRLKEKWFDNQFLHRVRPNNSSQASGKQQYSMRESWSALCISSNIVEIAALLIAEILRHLHLDVIKVYACVCVLQC